MNADCRINRPILFIKFRHLQKFCLKNLLFFSIKRLTVVVVIKSDYISTHSSLQKNFTILANSHQWLYCKFLIFSTIFTHVSFLIKTLLKNQISTGVNLLVQYQKTEQNTNHLEKYIPLKDLQDKNVRPQNHANLFDQNLKLSLLFQQIQLYWFK